MDPIRADQLLQYALVIAGQEDPENRELGPIHLIKYVYLGDLAYSAAHAGQTYTSAPWRFYHFGPWAQQVYARLPVALPMTGASERRFQGGGSDEGVRWQCTDELLLNRLERELPGEVIRAIKTAVREFGADTTALLHHVYCTPPMLKAAPGEMLDFTPADAAVEYELPAARPVSAATTVSKTALNKQEKVKAEFREKIAQRIAERKTRYSTPQPPPRYDETYQDGTQWLTGLGGEPIEAESGQLTFGDEVWKARGRREPDVS